MNEGESFRRRIRRNRPLSSAEAYMKFLVREK
jgi:hypothetical protein